MDFVCVCLCLHRHSSMWQILALVGYVTVVTIGAGTAAVVIDVVAYTFCLSFAMTFDI